MIYEAYLRWLGEHPNGFVLQVNQRSDQKLHRASCSRIGANGASPAQGEIWTSYAKRCSDDREELIGATSTCGFCQP